MGEWIGRDFGGCSGVQSRQVSKGAGVHSLGVEVIRFWGLGDQVWALVRVVRSWAKRV